MASGVGKWEVVKKGKKPNNSSVSGGKPQQQEKKSSRKALREANTSQTDTNRITSETIFDGFEKMGKKLNKEQVPPPVELQQKKPNTGKQTKKPPSNGSTKPTNYRTLEEAVKALDVLELKQQLEKSQSLFPENPSVWVKDLAGYLNYKLPAPDTDPTLSSYTHDYPYCLTGKELRGVIKNLLSKCSDTLPEFFDHCVFSMLREQDRQPCESLHGYRMCIQAIMQDKPKIAMLNLADHLELLRSHQNRPVKCLSIMWALGQAGFYDLSQGIIVWLGIMLPVLGIKSLSAYAIAYLERLLTLHANLTKGFGIMGPKEFFPLLDFAYMPKNALLPSLQEQLCRLYPRLKVLAFGAKPESTLHTYFPSFLSRATPNCPDAMKKELLNSLTECLSVDDQSLSVWRQLYTKHLSQSSLLLNHLLKSWNSLSPKLRKNLQDTIQSFRVTNEELQTTTNTQEIQECNTLCHSLQLKMRGQGFPWWRVLLMMLVFGAGFIAHDIRSQGSFADSTTSLYLETSGVTAASQQAWSKVSNYSQQGVSWLSENMPYYYSRAVEKLGPLLEDGQDRMKVAAVFITKKSSELLLWLQENVPLLIEWINVNTPESVFQCIEYVKDFLLYIHEQFIIPSLQYLNTALQHTWQNLQDSCNGEVSLHCLQNHLKSFTNVTWSYLQHATSAIKSRAQELLS
ncbi:transmembrane protein 214-B-like isoform X2 [Myxocyprinus asiaticus]|uniref:transmembrane protein 214-B-like isoform X2 n=1 Tax=Myxocyprinus asiaticus TaxID=70543 RepID=UPI0022236E62|nr:transmembrane protein 214-B-like isoform X2 [Myxocyprinus asiaticus]